MCQMELGPLVALIRKLMILMKAGTFFSHEQGGNTLTGQHSAVMKKLCKLFPSCSLSNGVNNRSLFFFMACFRNPNTTSCIVNYIEEELGCSPNIMGSDSKSRKLPCETTSQLSEMAKLSRSLDEADDTAIYDMTG